MLTKVDSKFRDHFDLQGLNHLIYDLENQVLKTECTINLSNDVEEVALMFDGIAVYKWNI